jgi:hypothetical protein
LKKGDELPLNNMKFTIPLFLAILLTTHLVFGQKDELDSENPPTNTFGAAPRPITNGERLRWVVKSTIGPQGLAAGVLTSGLGTARNKPDEYGPHWEGFGKRYGMRLTGISTGNATEAALGSLWKEDPRYFPSTQTLFRRRLSNIVVMTFAARRADGRLTPAYARYVAVPGANFLSNGWRPDSEAGIGDAGLRTLWGFLGRMGGNAFMEFWPDVKRLIHKNNP